jgi:hypothetical protein
MQELENLSCVSLLAEQLAEQSGTPVILFDVQNADTLALFQDYESRNKDQWLHVVNAPSIKNRKDHSN